MNMFSKTWKEFVRRLLAGLHQPGWWFWWSITVIVVCWLSDAGVPGFRGAAMKDTLVGAAIAVVVCTGLFGANLDPDPVELERKREKKS
jgi:hypothetical protein